MHQPVGAGRSPAPLIVTAVIAVAALFTLAVWLRGAPDAFAPSSGAAAPVIVVLEPADGARVTGGAVELVFETSEPIRAMPEGWGSGPYHIHLRVDGVSLMPARGEIDEVEPGRYRWRVVVAPGTRELGMYWSGPDHRPLPFGAPSPLRVHVE